MRLLLGRWVRWAPFVFGAIPLVACSASGGTDAFSSSTGGSRASVGTGGSAGGISLGGAGGASGNPFTGDPQTCSEAAAGKSYVGCDFWPTVVANNVWSIFDYAVIVANAGTATAQITVTGNGIQRKVSVPPNGLQKIYLPWVPQLKGQDWNSCTAAIPFPGSTLVKHGAYHLVSTVPVTVYQFNALEYKPAGGPSGKDWSSCPGYQVCFANGGPSGCYSYSNDASLLLPSTALTGNYRIVGHNGFAEAQIGAYFAVTGTADNTTVRVKVSQTGQVVGGGGIQSAPAGGVVSFNLNQGDVAEVLSTPAGDLSGSLVQANHPVQVISGVPCISLPDAYHPACDHIEESVFPAETLGQDYLVAPPTGPRDNVPGYIVRIFGNVDSTQLTYPAGKPARAPTTINAGQVVDLGQITQAFEVKGNHEFAVATFMLGGSIVDAQAPAGQQEGDPSQSQAVAVEQYRKKYVFLAPNDYDISYADVITPSDARVTLDGSPLRGQNSSVGSGYLVVRARLGSGANGAHVLISDKPVGLQVIGYGQYTSYQYPGGLNLQSIAPPPPPIK